MPKAQSNTKKILAKKETTKATTKKSSTPKKKTLTNKKNELINKFSKTQRTITTPTSQWISRKERKIHTGVRIFFGCSLFLFCIAVYYAILRPQSIETSNQKNLEMIVSDNNFSNEETNQNTENTPPILEESFGSLFLKEFYYQLSSKNITGVIDLMDKPLRNSSEIRRIFSEYRIVPFIDGIEYNQIFPENIELISTSNSGVEEYRYNINYKLADSDQTFAETRLTKIKFTDNGPKIASIHCESKRCSYNPFFRPESYGLIK